VIPPAALALLLVAAAAAARAAAARRTERAAAGAAAVRRGRPGGGRRPVELPGDGRGRAALLVHGFGDTPQTLAYLAGRLHARGWAVRAPLLPGHGRTLRAFAASGAAAWAGAVRDEYAALRARHGAGAVSLVGLSMGGALAATVAAELGDALPALVLLAPYTAMPTAVRRAAAVAPLVGLAVPYLRGGDERSILDPAARAASRAYGAMPPHLVRELAAVVRGARAALPRVAAPTLVVHSRTDYRVSQETARADFAALGAARKELRWLDGCGHIVTVDYGREGLCEAVADWLDAAAPAPGAGPRPA
jgi:carboxylesterase